MERWLGSSDRFATAIELLSQTGELSGIEARQVALAQDAARARMAAERA